jgi:hypothetical protein
MSQSASTNLHVVRSPALIAFLFTALRQSLAVAVKGLGMSAAPCSPGVDWFRIATGSRRRLASRTLQRYADHRKFIKDDDG